jgi:predicted TIM-barrel fold metal-dependent hydrolase
MIIDFRVRPPTKSFPRLTIFRPDLVASAAVGPWAGTTSPSHQQTSMPLFLEELKALDVRHAVVWGRAVTNVNESTPNDDVAAIVADAKGLFTGFAGVRIPGAGKIHESLAELDRAINTLGLKGITLEPGFSFSNTDGADDRRLYPIYERCQELGIIVAFTLSVRAGPSLRYSNPAAVDRVAGDFPGAKFVVGHAFWPWVSQGCGVAFRQENVYLLPDFYGVRMPGHKHWVEAANGFLSDRILFGSGYPVVDPAMLVGEYQKAGYSDAALDKIFHRNAARLLGLRH